jgi:DNA-binding MarR family transcriptional regulator
VDRLANGGYVRRQRRGEDHREVLISLTPKGEKVLRELSLHHKSELRNAGPMLVAALKRAMQASGGFERKSDTPAGKKKEKKKEQSRYMLGGQDRQKSAHGSTPANKD